MYNIPSLQPIMLIATLPILIAFLLVNYKQNVFSVTAFFVIVGNDWYVIWFYMAYMYKDWKNSNEEETPAPRNVPVKINGYSLMTDMVQINREQKVAHVLLQQKADGMKVDLTEAFWLKRGNFDGTREEWTEAIALVGATPVFVDVDPRTYNLDPALLEAAITPRTQAVIPVSLYGQ